MSQVCNEQQQLGGGKQVVGSKQKLAVPASSLRFLRKTRCRQLWGSETLYIFPTVPPCGRESTAGLSQVSARQWQDVLSRDGRYREGTLWSLGTQWNHLCSQGGKKDGGQTRGFTWRKKNLGDEEWQEDLKGQLLLRNGRVWDLPRKPSSGSYSPSCQEGMGLTCNTGSSV